MENKMAAINMDLSNYVTIGEYTRAFDALRDMISEGFTETHRRQDVTNGRIGKAEEKNSDLDKRLSKIEVTNIVKGAAKKIVIGMAVSLSVGIAAGVTVKVVGWLFGI